MTTKTKENNYKWVIYSDGSGHLEDTQGRRMASFDTIASEVKFRDTWEHFDGSFEEMKAYILSKAPTF